MDGCTLDMAIASYKTFHKTKVESGRHLCAGAPQNPSLHAQKKPALHDEAEKT